MSDSSIKTGIIGLGVVAGLSYLWYKLFNKEVVSQEESIRILNREEVYTILKEVKGQLFTILFTIPDLKTSLEQELLKKNIENTKDPKRISEMAREILHPDILKIIQRKEQLIYTKHNCTEEEVTHNLNKIYNKDEKIVELRKSIYDSLNDALEGKAPSLEVNKKVLDFLDKEKCLRIIKKILMDAGKRFQALFCELREKQDVQDLSFANPVVLRKLQDLKLGDVKRNMLREEGLGQFDDSPTEILGKVSQRFRKNDQDFNTRLEDMEKKHEEVMNKLAENPFRDQNFVDKIYGDVKENN